MPIIRQDDQYLPEMKNKRHSLNLNIRGISESPTLTINELSKKLQKSGKTVYRLGLGQ